MKKTKKLVTEISGRRGQECYYILCCAVDVAISCQPTEPTMTVILTEVSKRTGKKHKTASKALSRALEDIWEHGDRRRLQEIYGRTIIEKPTPKDLVCVLAQYLWEESKVREGQV